MIECSSWWRRLWIERSNCMRIVAFCLLPFIHSVSYSFSHWTHLRGFVQQLTWVDLLRHSYDSLVRRGEHFMYYHDYCWNYSENSIKLHSKARRERDEWIREAEWRGGSQLVQMSHPSSFQLFEYTHGAVLSLIEFLKFARASKKSSSRGAVNRKESGLNKGLFPLFLGGNRRGNGLLSIALD